MSGAKESLVNVFKGTPLAGVIPGPPIFLIVLPMLALVVGMTVIMGWVRKTARSLDAKKRQAAQAAAKKSN